MYRYSKMESYAEEEDLKHTVTAMAYILNSIKNVKHFPEVLKFNLKPC